jgi:hypothetical protein
MNRQQQHQEQHRVERQEKQKEERQSEEQFSKPGVTIRPFWFLLIGLALTAAAVAFWTSL